MMKIPEELLPVVEWWEKHGKKAIVVAVVAAVVGVACLLWNARQERAKAIAADATRSALATSAQGLRDPNSKEAAEAIQSLQDSVASFGNSGNAMLLKLVLADAYCRRANAEEKDYENALAIYEELAASGKVPAVYSDIPALGRAQCLEAMRKFDEALKAFDAFAAETPDGYQTLNAQLGAARCLAQLGKKDEAIARLEKLMKDKKAAEVLDRALPLEQQLSFYMMYRNQMLQSGNSSNVQALEAEIAKIQSQLRPDQVLLADAKAIRFTLDLVKRWVPADQRDMTELPKPAAPAPAPAETPAVEVKPAEAPAAAPEAAPAAPAPTEAK